MRLEIAMRVPRLHTIVRGTPISGYRQLQLSSSPRIALLYGAPVRSAPLLIEAGCSASCVVPPPLA
jgi:hypothetical protein